jgi:polysaccharide pyruvyl transferase WcaK-like protein
MCFGSGVEPLSNPALRKLARHCFDHVFVDALVRGARSAELLRSYGVTRDLRVAVDQAVSLRASSPEAAADHLEKSVGLDIRSEQMVTVSVKPSFIYRGGLLPVSLDLPGPSRQRRRQRRTRFESAFAQLLDHIVEATGAVVVLIPMYAGQGDVEASERVAGGASRRDRIRIMRDVPSSRVLKAVFGLAQAHVGVRLHSCILATSSGVPSLGVPYMVKATEYFERLGLDEFTLEEDAVTREALIDAFSRLWDRRDTVRTHLAATMPVAVDELTAHRDSAFSLILGSS